MSEEAELSDSEKEEGYKRLLTYQLDKMIKERDRHEKAVRHLDESIVIIIRSAKENGFSGKALRGVLEPYGYWPLPAKWIFAMRESPVRKQ